MSGDNVLYLRHWASDIRASNGKSVDADRLDAIADEIERLRQTADHVGYLEGVRVKLENEVIRLHHELSR